MRRVGPSVHFVLPIFRLGRSLRRRRAGPRLDRSKFHLPISNTSVSSTLGVLGDAKPVDTLRPL
jgi:hypothetical protein